MPFLKKFLKKMLFLPLVYGLGSLVPGPAFALSDVYVVQFVLDGVHKRFLHQQIEEGNLPNLKAHFFDRGAVFDQAITTFPTVSSPGYISFTTGLGAGNSGVFFLEWFDRTKQKVVGYLTAGGFNRVNSDLLNRLSLRNSGQEKLYPPLTLFEELSPSPSAAIYSPFRRGATYAIPKRLPLKALFSGLIAKDGLNLNPLAMKELEKLFAQSMKKIPRYTLVGLYGTDFYGHHDGHNSEEVALVLKQFDHHFKNFLETLSQRGLLEKTYLLLTSDHGMHASGKIFEIRDYLYQKGIHSKDPLYVSNRGVSSTFIYVAGEEGWEELPTPSRLRNFSTKRGRINLIQTLLEHEAIDWLAVRQDLDHVQVLDQTGEGQILGLWIGEKRFYAYTFKGRDPLGFAEDPHLASLLDGKPHPQEIWFQKTFNTNRPNAVVELSQLFQDPRAGDILVVAKDSWGFRKAKAGTHGSLHAEDMQIPLWIAGPGVPVGRYGEARGVDLFPTLLRWFGLARETELNHQEGKALFAAKEEAKEDPAEVWLAQLEQEMMNRPSLFKIADKDDVIRKLKAMLPDSIEEEVFKACEEEIDQRYRRWKKLDALEAEVKNPRNSLEVSPHLRKNMDWLLANEKNIEFMRLRRMEDIKTILENP